MDDQAQNSLLVASRAWFHAPLQDFVQLVPEQILGTLTRNADFAVDPDQRDAWLAQIETLQTQLAGIEGNIYLEFNIPRMGKRIDAVVLASGVVFVIEFKLTKADRAAIEQAWDYALDLKNFHEGTHNATVVPIVVAADARTTAGAQRHEDGVFEPVAVKPDGLRAVMDRLVTQTAPAMLNATEWHGAPYRPTPTIIEAARALYAQHGVEAIRCFDAGKQNLGLTSTRLEDIVRDARDNKRKAICFVTGVPGAGKTLVGLNLATQHRGEVSADPAVFLSGNGPLVAVLREALTRDEYGRRTRAGEKVRKGKVGESVKAFIQNVHHFRDDNLQHAGAPVEHVAIFDEAQRAWDLQMTANFMRRKKNKPGFNQSEPEYLISCMDRHDDWAVIVCLVGGGQEINTGEAGIEAWLEAVVRRFRHWDVHVSSNLHDSEYAAGAAMQLVQSHAHAQLDDQLHLAVSMRSFRAENVSSFVKALLDQDTGEAQAHLGQLTRYPVRITRDLAAAKAWVRQKARGSERYGLEPFSKTPK